MRRRPARRTAGAERLGKQVRFEDPETRILFSVAPSDEFDKSFVLRNPSVATLDTSPHMSAHETNTERLVVKNSSIRHMEGGWPKDRRRRGADGREPVPQEGGEGRGHKTTMKNLGPIISRCMRQNNTIDIYEYFERRPRLVGRAAERQGPRGLPGTPTPKRAATSIHWHPEGPTKIAVSYSILNFQDSRRCARRAAPVQSYIWDIINPNTPDTELTPPSPLLPALQPEVDGHARRRLLQRPHALVGHAPGEPADKLLLNSDTKGSGMVLGGSSMEYNKEIRRSTSWARSRASSSPSI
ncbi:dynein heavy chain binding protein [Aureococcus anophagefferens]|uniref:Dynein heavy chain binding protein n=1 Tax=Aureococcus anophagefferens TaxID=44056 RepID=A0ABR1FSB8_AURAN